MLNQLYDIRDKMLDVAIKHDKYKDAEHLKLAAKPKTYSGIAVKL